MTSGLMTTGFCFVKKRERMEVRETVITRRIKKGGLLTVGFVGLQNLTPGSFLQYDLTANTECSDADGLSG